MTDNLRSYLKTHSYSECSVCQFVDIGSKAMRPCTRFNPLVEEMKSKQGKIPQSCSGKMVYKILGPQVTQ